MSKYIGCQIIFKSRGSYIIRNIISISKQSIKINHTDLNNNLCLSRTIYVII
jgi:hypothetical protein